MDLYEDQTKLAFAGLFRGAATVGRGLLGRIGGAASGQASAHAPGLLRRGASTAYNFGKGMLFMDPSEGASVGGRAANMAGKGFSMLGPMAANAAPANEGPGSATIGPWTVGGPKTAALAFERGFAKRAGLSVTDGLDATAYAAFLASKFVPEHHWAHTGLDAAGLAILGGTTAFDLARGHHRRAALKDLVGLALMGSALHDRHAAPHT